MTTKPLKSAVSYKYLKPDPKPKLYSDEHVATNTTVTRRTVEKKEDVLSSLELSDSFHNDYDEMRDILKNTIEMIHDIALLKQEETKLHLENMRQISELITLIRESHNESTDKFNKLVSIFMLQQNELKNNSASKIPLVRSKTPERAATLRVGSRKSQLFSGEMLSTQNLSHTHNSIPTIRSKN
jgi:RNAse (barnase) inhibitor barstar